MTAASDHRVLVVDDEPDLLTLYELTLLREGYGVDTAGTVGEALQALGEASYDAIITDMRLPDGTGLDVLRHLESRGGRERAVVITAFGSAENAVEALKCGAFDYLTKPVDLRQFRGVVAAAVGRTVAASPAGAGRTGTLRRDTPPARAALARLAGGSPAIESVRTLVRKVARSMAPVLVTGESGTGKELVARAVHEESPRAGGPFVAVNCGAIPEHLLEAEFFGFRKGAFTGAQEDREGFFQAADGGTLFLDEIGELPLSMQPKLLRAIQERSVRAVGAVGETPVSVRLVCATHRDLAADVAAQRFRQDLFYRLNVIQIHVPPLRDRREDLPVITDRLLERIARDAGLPRAPRLSEAARHALASRDFPGNVRELENLLHRAVALGGDDDIDAADLGPSRSPSEPPAAPLPLVDGAVGATVGASPAASGRPDGDLADLPALPVDLAAHLDEVERRILQQALEAHRFNRTAAGASLGLSLRQMRYRMARLGITAPGDGSAGD